jgi:hypothetical protein
VLHATPIRSLIRCPIRQLLCRGTAGLAPSRDSPLSDAVCCKAVRSGPRLIRDTTRHQPSQGEYDSRAAVHRRCTPYRGSVCGQGDPHAARPCRRRNAAARSRPHCRRRHRSALRSIRRLSGVSGCPLPQWLGTSSRRILRPLLLSVRSVSRVEVGTGREPTDHLPWELPPCRPTNRPRRSATANRNGRRDRSPRRGIGYGHRVTRVQDALRVWPLMVRA